MFSVNYATCNLTGKVANATICPELRSDDGSLICDGIADADLLSMFPFATDANGKCMPAALLADDDGDLLPTAKRMPMQASDKMLASWSLIDYTEGDEKAANLAAHTKRIRENESRWNDKLVTDDDVKQYVRENPAFVVGLMRLMNAVENAV